MKNKKGYTMEEALLMKKEQMQLQRIALNKALKKQQRVETVLSTFIIITIIYITISSLSASNENNIKKCMTTGASATTCSRKLS